MVKLKCFVLHLAENTFVISQLSFGGAKARTGAFHFESLQSVVRRLRTTQPQAFAFPFHGVRLCTTGEEAEISFAVARSPALSHIRMNHHA